MRAFTCPSCAQLVFFENSVCVRCDTPLGLDPDTLELVDATDRVRCANAEVAACNWLVADQGLCVSCGLTRTRPADDDPDGIDAWVETEQAKRRLTYQLLDLGLTFDDLVFDLLSDRDGAVTTGHADGVVTLDLSEADDVHRTALREQLDEPYRTMLGHLRHEVGHYFWLVLVDRPGRHEAFRAIFGDERDDYGAALQRHYDGEPPADWQEGYVSTYATAHPWEDWAETFAHVLHMRASLQTAAAHGVTVDAPAPAQRSAPDTVDEDTDLPGVVAEWLPLTYALNAVNASMGHEPLYPFVLSPTVIAKLSFVDDLVTG